MVSTIEAHPELEAEQTYVDRAYQCMEAMLAKVEKLPITGRNDYEEWVFERWKSARLLALSDVTSALVFGRLLEEHGDDWYIGRRHVEDGQGHTIVVDWRAPVAARFYRATHAESMGLRRRRQFLAEGRQLLGLSDDDFRDVVADGPVRAEDVLALELARRRTGEIRDIVATIQAEQDVIIRAPLEGVVVVQGGPGTGKTAIGLHRASYLLFEHRNRLVRQGVLVVGPNRTFLKYIAQVLPSLGETAVMQTTVAGLAPSVTVGAPVAVDGERLRGDARMAEVLARSLAARRQPLNDDVVLFTRGERVVLTTARAAAQVAALEVRGIPYARGRAALRDELLHVLYREYTRASASAGPYEEVIRDLRRAPVFTAALNRLWPAVTPATLVKDLLTKPARLAEAADGVLTPGEQGTLLRKGRRDWSPAELPLLDEAESLVNGSPRTYGHVVVDEAQDLSPMALRVLARRCPAGSMTVLGDLGQATGLWAHDTWDEVLAHLPDGDGGHRVEQLTLGYRVSAPIMRIAAAVLASAAPHVAAPLAVSREQEPARQLAVAASEVAGTAAAEAVAFTGRPGAIAVIAPSSLYAAVRAALEEAGAPFAEAARDGLDARISLVAAEASKGLEFDAVVLVEPAAVVEESTGGLRLLYVTLTRAMRSLVMVHARPLPGAISEPAAAA